MSVTASFTRDSDAYLSDGTLVRPNVPRFENGKFDKAIMVEEGTTNRLTTVDFESWVNYITDESIGEMYFRQDELRGKVLRLKKTDTGTGRYGKRSSLSGMTGSVYNHSVYVRALSSTGRIACMYVDAQRSGGGNITSPKFFNLSDLPLGEWVRITTTHDGSPNTLSGGGSVFVWIDNAPGECEFALPQVELKPYTTSFTPGTRAPEVLTIPTAEVLTDSGPWTVEFFGKINSYLNQTRVLFSAWPKFYVAIGHTSRALLSWTDGTQQTAYSSLSIPDITGWHYWALSWDGTVAKVYVDAVKLIEVTTNLPSSLTSIAHIGRFGSSNVYSSLIDDLRISNIARTDAEIAAAYASNQPLPKDDYTTCKLSFDLTLRDKEGKYVVYDNTPQSGYIQWENLSIGYQGMMYDIADGYTNGTYVWWDFDKPYELQSSNTLPELTEDDVLVLLNKNGTHMTVPTASVVDGGLIVPESIMADAIAANAITGNKILAGSISSDKIAAGAVGAEAIAANAIAAQHIMAGAITSDHISANGIIGNKIIGGEILAGLVNIVGKDESGNSVVQIGHYEGLGPQTATFTRASVAYKQDGTQVASGVPRFEAGQFGQAVMIEEGTTQEYINSELTSLTEWSTPDTNLSAAVYGENYGNSGIVKLTKGAVTPQPYMSFRQGVPAVVGGIYTCSFKCKVLSGGAVLDRVRVHFNGSNIVPTGSVDLGNGWWLLWLTGEAVDSNIYSGIGITGDDACEVLFTQPMMEYKAYKTSYHPSTRATEILKIPTAGVMNPKEGTIEFWLKVPIVTNYNTFLSFTTDNGRFFLFFTSNGDVRWDYGPANSGPMKMSTITRDNYYHIALRWSASLNKQSLSINGTHSTQDLPNGVATSFPATVSVVNNYSALVGDLRISSEYLTDAEITADFASGEPLPVDEHTTYKLSFDGHLQPSIRKFGIDVRGGEIRTDVLVVGRTAGGIVDAIDGFGSGKDGYFNSNGNITFTVDSEDISTVIKHYNSFILNTGHTLTVDKRCKGLFIFVRGDCIINGTIDMTGKAAKMSPSGAGLIQVPIGVPILELPVGGPGGDGGSGGRGGITSGFGSPRTNGGNGTLGAPGRWFGGGFGGPGGGGGGGGRTDIVHGSDGGNAGICNYDLPFGNGGSGSNDMDTPGGTGGNFAGGGGGYGMGGAGGGGGGAGMSGGYGGYSGATSTEYGANGATNYAIGGGSVVIVCKGNFTIGSGGSIIAKGNNGGAGGRGGDALPTGDSGSGGGGGGQGGGGGGTVAILHGGAYINYGTINVNGGSGGSGGSPGVPGQTEVFPGHTGMSGYAGNSGTSGGIGKIIVIKV